MADDATTGRASFVTAERSRPPVRLFWWRWKHPHRLNFGDELTAPLIERLTGRRVEWSPLDTCDVVGAGSVIQMVLRGAKTNEPALWGSGFIRVEAEDEGLHTLDARAVRGQLSLARLSEERRAGVALGDPGILASLLVDGKVSKKYAVGIVPHYHDAASPEVGRLAALGRNVRVIDVAWTPEEVAREIASCDVVLSSSMHGLIFADSLGVPNLHLKLGDKLVGGTYKFRDYNSIFPGNRYRTYSLAEGFPGSYREVVEKVASRYIPPEGIGDRQEALVRALPVQSGL